jgi:hypothetical protein
MDRAVQLAVIGAGNRGRYTYGRWCLHEPDRARGGGAPGPAAARGAGGGRRPPPPPHPASTI